MNVVWKVEQAEHAESNVPTCGKIAVWQLCRERQPFLNSHDGLNLTCLDQCHGVGSHGTSSSQGWRKGIAIEQSKFDPWVHILVFAEGDCCRFAYWTSVFFCGCASNARFAQGQPKGYFQKKELDRTTEAFAHMNADWKVEGPACWVQRANMWQDCSLTVFGTVMMAWIWHVWINAMVLVPMAQAPPKADAKELL